MQFKNYIVTQINTGVSWMDLILKIITGMFLIALGILFKENEIRKNMKGFCPLRIK
jgi:hypothetical protein